MTPTQLRLRTLARGATALAAFTLAITIVVIALQNLVVGLVLAAVLWAIVIRGQLWRF